MFKKLLAGATTLLLALGVVALSTSPALAGEKLHNGEKVTICHSPSSASNPWVKESPNVNSMKDDGHIDPSVDDTHADDIIPPFWYDVHDSGSDWHEEYYPGKNLSTNFGGYTGAEILANGCNVPTSAAVTGVGSPETCSAAAVVPGSITLTVKIAGATVSLPAAGLTVKVTGPGFPVATTVTSTVLSGLANGDYTFTVTSDASHKLTTATPFTVTVGDSGPCVVDDDDVSVTAVPDPEVCDDGDVIGGSITLTVKIGGGAVSIPASGVTITVSGPGFAANTPVTSGVLNDLADGVYTFNVSVGSGLALTTPAEFTATVGDSGDCALTPVSLTATPSPEVCDTQNPGAVTGGTIALVLKVDGSVVSIPASGVTITISGPGFAGATPVTSDTVTGLADGLYSFHVEVGSGKMLTSAADFDSLVGDSGPCTVVDDADVSVTAIPADESCDVINGDVLPGSIALKVKVDGVAITLPATGVTVKVEGPGYAVPTTLTGTSLTGLANGTYTFTVTVGSGNVLVTTSPFDAEVGDFDIFDCLQLVDHPLVIPDVDYVEPTCSADGSYTLSNDQTIPSDLVQAVSWTVNGTPKLESTYPAVAGSTVHIVADANGPDYGFDTGNTIETITFDHTFSTPAVCDLTTLAITGQDPAPFLAMAGFLGLLGVGLVRASNRIARRMES